MPSPPDLSSHILSDDLALQIFTTTILPTEFPNATVPSTGHSPDTQPLAVLLLGQTGAGKTRTAPTLHAAIRSLRGSAPAHFIADTYKAFHPSYAALLVSHSQAIASAAASPDARRWLSMAADAAISRRVDVLLESACRHPSDFTDLAERFKVGGYRVEVVVLAVPEGLSRLGIMTRFYQNLPEAGFRGLPSRLTPKKVHDDSYAGLLASAQWLDQGKVDQILVVRRGNLVVFGSESVGGRLSGSVADAVRVERERPLSGDEVRHVEEDLRRLEGVEEAAAGFEEVKLLLEPLLKGSSGRAVDFPPLRPLLFPDPKDATSRPDNMLMLGVRS
ncbi:uncharacterized protein DNG_05683 [Cephalotrichum gorgonifer]|uniref:Zeta toxin domain-containing protein n=1 Tax=Cephalotrichum gorgonifer TaxID=2041049 RepID=A0AAE8SWH3_9PEZI|nr:uncharacterized protein DNG_05683 [Cephalotrichum gorgonifer]